VKVIADTNVLLRLILGDDSEQGAVAATMMQTAETVVISAHSLCELVWVLRSRPEMTRVEVGEVVRTIVAAVNVSVDRPVVEAGLVMLDHGSDFADGVIAYDGRRLGGATFVSFDKRAVDRLAKQGVSAHLLS
jgi:predicted nucleic-acid-binding protein